MSAVQLTSAQWRDIVFGNLSRMLGYIQNVNEVGPRDSAAIQRTLDETKGFVAAWHLAGLPRQEVPHEAAKPHENGVVGEPVVQAKRKGGWPAGKKRGPRKPKTVEAQA